MGCKRASSTLLSCPRRRASSNHRCRLLDHALSRMMTAELCHDWPWKPQPPNAKSRTPLFTRAPDMNDIPKPAAFDPATAGWERYGHDDTGFIGLVGPFWSRPKKTDMGD